MNSGQGSPVYPSLCELLFQEKAPLALEKQIQHPTRVPTEENGLGAKNRVKRLRIWECLWKWKVDGRDKERQGFYLPFHV